MTQYLVIKSSLKNVVRDKDLNMGEGFFEELNKEMHRLILNAAKRARENGRKTVYGKDV